LRNKKLVIFILLVLSLTPAALAAQDQQIAQKLAALQNIQGKFTFIVLGDNRSGDEVYRKLVNMAMERRPDFVVNTGDMIATPGDKQEWAKFWEMSGPVIVPYFLTVGNHDVHSRVPLSESTYKQEVDLPGNELYYSFRTGASLFVILDAYLDDQEKKITGEQFVWLEDLLAKARPGRKFVFLHHPLYPDKNRGKHHGNSLDRYPTERDRLQALFVKYKVTAVFAGHEHLYLRKTIEGIPHVITGGGGAPLYADEPNGGFHHYIHMTVDGDKVSGEVVDIKGQVKDRF
jgi:3',5'-cyclic AMP phosphodiesterase CpdA